MNIGQLLMGIAIFLLLNTAIPALLNVLDINTAEYYTPFQVFALAYLILFVFLPRKVMNPFA